jgi:transposase
VHHLDLETGEIVNKAIKCVGFLEYFANRSPCVIGMEAQPTGIKTANPERK